MSPLRTSLAVLASAALLAALPAGAHAQSSADSPTPGEPSSSQVHEKKGKKKRAPRRLTDAQLTSVAEALGTTLSALKEARSAVKAAVEASPERETRAQRDAMLAERLGVTAAEVRSAFASVRSSGPRRGGRHGGRRGGCRKPAPTTDPGTGTYPEDGAGTPPGAS